MLERWIPLQRYTLLRSSDNAVSVADLPPQVRISEWFAHRRVRTALIIGALLASIIFLSHFVQLVPPGPVPPQQIAESPSPTTGDESAPATTDDDRVQWSNFAYVQYVTNEKYLCNSLMILETLLHLEAKADRIMMYPADWHVAENDAADATTNSKLLARARDLYQAKLIPIKVQSFEKGDSTWKESYTKLLAFNQTQYKRVMSIDSDAVVRKHMDELFLLPSSPVAMPRAYWLDQPFFSSQLVLIEPSTAEWHRVQQFMNRDDSGFDMDILNTIYKDSCIVIPHRRYNLLTAEFRADSHERYLGSSDEAWDGSEVFEEAKFVHFSDWPVPKPWLQPSDSVMTEHQPKCSQTQDGKSDCRDRDIWLNLYKDFSSRRQVCGRSYGKRESPQSFESAPAALPRHETVVR